MITHTSTHSTETRQTRSHILAHTCKAHRHSSSDMSSSIVLQTGPQPCPTAQHSTAQHTQHGSLSPCPRPLVLLLLPLMHQRRLHVHELTISYHKRTNPPQTSPSHFCATSACPNSCRQTSFGLADTLYLSVSCIHQQLELWQVGEGVRPDGSCYS